MMSLLTKTSIVFQIYKNRARRSCDGLSMPFFAFGFASYGLSATYGLLVSKSGGLLISLAAAPGALLSLVVLGQYVLYDRLSR